MFPKNVMAKTKKLEKLLEIGPWVFLKYSDWIYTTLGKKAIAYIAKIPMQGTFFVAKNIEDNQEFFGLLFNCGDMRQLEEDIVARGPTIGMRRVAKRGELIDYHILAYTHDEQSAAAIWNSFNGGS